MYKFIIFLQGALIMGTMAGPIFDGQLDLSITPFAWNKTIGIILGITGFIFAILAILTMQNSFTIFIPPRTKGNLVKSGVFSLCRNPIYLGLLLFVFGWSIFFNSQLAIFNTLFLSVILVKKMSLEEIELTKKFGKEYLAYKESTKKLIPFIY